MRVAAFVPGRDGIGSRPPPLADPISDRAISSSRSCHPHSARPDGLADLVGPVLGPDPDLEGASAVVAARLVRRGPRPGALAACLARREFDPRRCVPFDAFLYRRVVEAVWTRHRQEWNFGSRAKPDDDVSVANVLQCSLPDPDLLEHMTHALVQLTEPERRLIHQLFWDGHSVGELARVSGVSQERLRTRKSRALHKLRVYLGECV